MSSSALHGCEWLSFQALCEIVKEKNVKEANSRKRSKYIRRFINKIILITFIIIVRNKNSDTDCFVSLLFSAK